MYNGVDLSGIDRDRLVRGAGRKNPRTRQGDYYPLNLTPASTLIDNGQRTISKNAGAASESDTIDVSVLTERKEKGRKEKGKVRSKGADDRSHTKKRERDEAVNAFLFDSEDDDVAAPAKKGTKLKVLKKKKKEPLEGERNELVQLNSKKRKNWEGRKETTEVSSKKRNIGTDNTTNAKDNKNDTLKNRKDDVPKPLLQKVANEVGTEKGDKVSQNSQNSRSNEAKAFGDFKMEYRALLDIEFGSIERVRPKLPRLMWENHKVLMGDSSSCGSACTCFRQIEALMDGVVDKCIANLKERGESNVADASLIQKSMTGFIDHFKPRFYDKLANEYPSDSPKQLLQRLLKMWSFHVGQKCHSKCTCGSDWEVRFGKGDPKKDITSQGTSLTSNNGAIQETSNGKNGRTPSMQQKGFLDRPIAKKSRPSSTLPSSLISSKTSSSSSTVYKKYEVKFKTSEPMGAFFVTEGQKCKVKSLFDAGQAKRDLRVTRGELKHLCRKKYVECLSHHLSRRNHCRLSKN